MRMSQKVEMGGPEQLSTSVIEAIADHKGVDPTALEPPLFDAVDPDALDSLFTNGEDTPAETTGHVTFAYNGIEVQVTNTGDVRIDDTT